MKLITLFFLTHLIAAGVALAAARTVESYNGTTLWLAAAFGVLLAVGGSAFWLTRRCCAALDTLESVVAVPNDRSRPSTGIDEFDQAATRFAGHADSWDEMAANNQEQARQLQAILMALDPHTGASGASSRQLRAVLASLGGGLQGLLSQMQQSTREVGQCTQKIADGAEAQGSAVIKTSTYIEQLSTNIGTVSDHAEAVQEGILSTKQSAGDALDRVRQLTQGIERIRSHSESSEKKLRRLADPSRQISSIVETIGDIAARTDLLALNASIESIRAGEHGRGFAVVADEVRKLAEQAAQATREISGLIESMQLETQESIAAIARERSEAESEVQLATTTEQVLDQICTQSESEAARAKEITRAAHQQLQLTQDVVLAMEQISNVAKSGRRQADSAQWSMKSLAEISGELDREIGRLKQCADNRHPSNRASSVEDPRHGRQSTDRQPSDLHSGGLPAGRNPVSQPVAPAAELPVPDTSGSVQIG